MGGDKKKWGKADLVSNADLQKAFYIFWMR